jgi:hypothetical protein
LHALLLISGALLPDPKCSAPVTASPVQLHRPHAHLRVTLRHLLCPTRRKLRNFSRHARPCARTPFLLKSASAAADGSIACSLVSAYGRTGDPVGVARKVFD